ncbi:hypothetical protein SMICM304S_09812 [Streptomyces microflavus]
MSPWPPHAELGDNRLAGVWKVAATARANDGKGVADQQAAGAFRMMRKTDYPCRRHARAGHRGR